MATNNSVNTRTNPLFKAVLTTTSSNVTGAGTTYYFGTGGAGVVSIVADRNSNVAVALGNVVFTAPVTGIYYMLMTIELNGITALMTHADLAFEVNGSTYVWGASANAANMANALGDYIVNANGILTLTAGDTVRFFITIRNGALDTCSIRGNSTTVDQSYVSGYLIG